MEEYVETIIDARTLPESKGAYDMLREIGSGSFSTVYAVRHRETKKFAHRMFLTSTVFSQ